MRKFLWGVAAVLALIIVGGGVGIFMLVRTGNALDAEGSAYVRDTVVTVTGAASFRADWSGWASSGEGTVATEVLSHINSTI